MQIVIIFHNIGGYHVGRIRASQTQFDKNNWSLTAIQVTDSSADHPWGSVENTSFEIETLLPPEDANNQIDRTLNSRLAARNLLKRLDFLNPDVVIIPGWGSAIPHTALGWTQKHKKVSVLMSESKWNDSTRQWWSEWIKSNLYVKKFDAAIVGGKLHQEYLMKLGFPSEGIFFGYDIVDNDYFTQQAKKASTTSIEIRRQYPQIPTNPFFITVTRFIPRKNVLRLIESFATYRQQFIGDRPWDLVICGSGEEEGAIRQLIAINNLEDCVHLPGFLTYQEIPKWFALASVFIHPALKEQWGLVVNEAMASGLPVMVSDRCGCFPELVLEGKNGFGFNPENVDQLVDLMLKISSGEIDVEEMGRVSQEHIQNFSPEYFAKGLSQAVEYAIDHA